MQKEGSQEYDETFNNNNISMEKFHSFKNFLTGGEQVLLVLVFILEVENKNNIVFPSGPTMPTVFSCCVKQDAIFSVLDPMVTEKEE